MISINYINNVAQVLLILTNNTSDQISRCIRANQIYILKKHNCALIISYAPTYTKQNILNNTTTKKKSAIAFCVP